MSKSAPSTAVNAKKTQSQFIKKLKSQVRPILLKGHERSLTQVKYNQDGDLLFSASKDVNPTVWYADNGERLGTYAPHKGAVWDIDPSWDSAYVLTACADGYARMFETTTGKLICSMPHNGAVRAVAWGEGNDYFATASDPFTSRELGVISIFTFPSEVVLNSPNKLHVPSLEIKVDDNDRCTCLAWTLENKCIIAGFDSGHIIKYDTATGRELQRLRVHNDRINRLSFTADKGFFVTASKDTTAKLIDEENFEVMKTYKTDRPVNGVAISPIHHHVLLGGGQDAMSVTVTSASQGKFETRFFHTIFEEEFGRIKGHFGPINAIAMNPNGRSFASGGEDGFVRVHFFDDEYLNMPDYIPDELQELVE